MANWSELKTAIAQTIKTNGNGEITGQILQDALNTIISNLGAGATYVGFATPSTNPGTPDGNVFYLATEKGTYSNFGGLSVTQGLNVLAWDGSTWTLTEAYQLSDTLGYGQTAISQNAVTKALILNSTSNANIANYLKKNYYIKSDGSLVAFTGWYTYDKIPVYKGDTFIASFYQILAASGGATYVVFDSDKNVIKYGNIQYPNITFDQDGYLSFCFNSTQTNNYYGIVGNTSLQKQVEDVDTKIKAQKEKDISAYFAKNYYLKSDGSLVAFTGWYTYDKIPVYKGDTFIASFYQILVASGGATYVVFDSDKNVIKYGNIQYPNITFDQDGYLSFCFNSTQTNTYSVIQMLYLQDVLDIVEGGSASKIKWAAIGDSITAGNESNTGTSYATFAKELLGSSVSLNKLGYWGYRIQNRLMQAYEKIEDDTDIVTMNLGSNDILVLSESEWGDVDAIIAKSADDLVEDASSFENLRIFFEKMRANHPSTLIYVINPIKRSDNTLSTKFNEKELKLCKYYGIPVLDAYNESGIRLRDPIYTVDGTHPNDAGKLLIARWLVSKINFLNL